MPLIYSPTTGREGEPIRWNICFVTKSDHWLLDRLIPGRFKHVRAFGFVPDEGLWIFYDVALEGTTLKVARDRSGLCKHLLSAWTANSEILALPRTIRPGPFPPGFWCVPAIKHLLGIKSGALRPDRLWRDCIRQGAIVFNELQSAESAEPSAGPA